MVCMMARTCPPTKTSKTLSESSLVFQQITSKLDIFINCKASFCLIGVSQTLMKPWKGFKKKTDPILIMTAFDFSRFSMDWFHSVWCKLPFRPSSEQFVSKIQLSPCSCSGWSYCSPWFLDDVIC